MREILKSKGVIYYTIDELFITLLSFMVSIMFNCFSYLFFRDYFYYSFYTYVFLVYSSWWYFLAHTLLSLCILIYYYIYKPNIVNQEDILVMIVLEFSIFVLGVILFPFFRSSNMFVWGFLSVFLF